MGPPRAERRREEGGGRREGAEAAGWPARHADGGAAHLPEMTWMGLPSSTSRSSLMPKELEPPTALLDPAAAPATQSASSSSGPIILGMTPLVVHAKTPLGARGGWERAPRPVRRLNKP